MSPLTLPYRIRAQLVSDYILSLASLIKLCYHFKKLILSLYPVVRWCCVNTGHTSDHKNPKPLKMKNQKYFKWAVLIVFALFIMTSCAPGNERFTEVDPAGFWAGLWHGFISLVTFVISLFNENVSIYEIENSGWPYNLGFIIGIMIFYGGGSKTSCMRK